MINLKELIQKADAATPGPWYKIRSQNIKKNAQHKSHQIVCSLKHGVFIIYADVLSQGQKLDAEFIAAANPATVKTLCEQIQKTMKALQTGYRDGTNLNEVVLKTLQELREVIE